MPIDYILGLAGGVVIGTAAAGLLVLSGRIAGISGIVGGALDRLTASDREPWRWWFVAGLLAGGFAMLWLYPGAFPKNVGLGSLGARDWIQLVVAGLLVGFGTRLGNGCTSGHGVCGIGRLAPRSLLATATFVATGALVVALVRVLGGLS